MRVRERCFKSAGLALGLLLSAACRPVSQVWNALEMSCLPAEAVLSEGFAGSSAARFGLILDDAIQDAASAHGVSADLIRAVIQTESEFDPLAVSSRGACGLMQLMPVTARRFGVSDCFDPRQNILAGTRFLKSLLTRYRGSVALSIAAYNAGESAVARHRGIPPYAQTRAYVRRVQALLRTS
jgi:soluble lytic murein transglycosylase-like protein